MVATVAELDQGRRRSVEVRVKLSPALADEFFSLAEGRGLLPATLAASALGEYVERARLNSSIARMVALDASKRMTEAFADPEKVAQMVAACVATPEVGKIITSLANPEGE